MTWTIGSILGALAIIGGIIAAVLTKHEFLNMDSLTWFVLAIAFAVVLGGYAVARGGTVTTTT